MRKWILMLVILSAFAVGIIGCGKSGGNGVGGKVIITGSGG
jgi:hypothetical protein